MNRSGMVLIIVVVVVAMISLAGLGFVATMHSQRKTVQLEADELRLEAAVGSGVELLKAFLEQSASDREKSGGTWDNPDVFKAVSLEDKTSAKDGPRFSVVAPRDQEGEAVGLRFGTENESGRLNLGVLARWDQRDPGTGRRALMSLPGMTESVADSILDWIDGDNAARQFGAEADYYEGLAVPYSPRNGTPQCLEELLLVRGVTRGLLFGADANLNHQVDANERKAAASRSDDLPSAGRLPWASLLTVASAERNESADGRPRVDLNAPNLSELQRRLGTVLDSKWVEFILLYRQYGPYRGSKTPTSGASVAVDLNKPARFRIVSPLDLIGAKVLIPAAPGADETTATVVPSPWTNEPAAMRDDLSKLLDYVAVVPGPVIPGRVNLNLAPRAVLLAVPGMESALVEKILGSRGLGTPGDDAARRHAAWPLAEGLVDLPRMKALLPYLTTGGDVHRAQIVGFFDAGGRSVRAEVVVDATVRPARQVYYKDLRVFGRAYALQRLGAEPGE